MSVRSASLWLRGVPPQPDEADARVLGHQPADDGGAAVRAAVVHEEDLGGTAQPVENLAQLRVEERQVRRLVVDGDDDRERRTVARS